MTSHTKLALIQEFGTPNQLKLATSHPDLIDTIYNTIVGH